MSGRKVKKAEIFENKFLHIIYEDGTLCQIDLERLFDIEFIKEKKTSKELTPLEALERIKKWFPFKVNELEYQDICIIETALKNYQELLERPCVLVGRTNGHTKALIDMISKNYKEIKITNLDDDKQLKALEIIKEYFVLTSEYGQVSLETKKLIPEDKYDLLKEVLL